MQLVGLEKLESLSGIEFLSELQALRVSELDRCSLRVDLSLVDRCIMFDGQRHLCAY